MRLNPNIPTKEEFLATCDRIMRERGLKPAFVPRQNPDTGQFEMERALPLDVLLDAAEELGEDRQRTARVLDEAVAAGTLQAFRR